MKILHLLNSDRFSGAENVVCQIIHMMKGYPQYEHVYCSRDGQIRQALCDRGVTFVSVKDMTIGEVKRVIREENPDLIHAHDMRASLFAALSCGNIPLVSHIHNNSFESRVISFKTLAYLYAGLKAKHIFWVSESSCQGYFFRPLVKKKSEVLCNIIDINALHERMHLDTSEYDYDVVYVGRLTYPKNPQRLLQVMQLVVALRPLASIAIVGTGELEEETKALAVELGLEKNVDFLGFQSNPLKIMHDSKVMVMTSRWEGTPMCALEAMALGVPIVSTPTDGIAEIVKEGMNGFLGNDDHILANRIVQLIDDSRLQRSMAEHARKSAIEINNVDVYCQKLTQVYGTAKHRV